ATSAPIIQIIPYVSTLIDPLQTVGASLLGGGFLPLLGRFWRSSDTKTATTTQDSKELAVTGLILEWIWDDIAIQMNYQLGQMAKTLSWQDLQDAANMLIETQIAMGKITRQNGDTALAAILAITSDQDPKKDTTHRYRAL